jgi:hypothetical protein
LSGKERKALWEYATGGGWTVLDRKTDTEAKWKREGDAAWFSFRHTTSFPDWVLNLFFCWFPLFWRKSGVCFCHAGIWLKWLRIEPVLQAAVKQYLAGGVTSFRCGGHSQGGGLAILFHKMLRDRFKLEDAETHCFGSLRIWWFCNLKKIKDSFKGLYIWKTRGDLVPRLPPELFGFRDAGEPHLVGKRVFPWPWAAKYWHTCYGDYVGRDGEA